MRKLTLREALELSIKQPNDALRLVDEIKPILAGHSPEMQGAALADLVAMFIAGHHPDLRDEMLKIWLDTVTDLIPINVEQLIEQHGPNPWEAQ